MLISGVEKQIFLPQVIDNLDVMVWIKDEDNNLVYLNSSAKHNLFGCADQEEVDMSKCPLSCKVSKITDEREDIIEEVEINGEIIYLNCKKMPLYDGGMMVIAEDVTQKSIKNKVAVNVLNKKIDVWKEKREVRVNQSARAIDELIRSVKQIKRERNINE